MILEFGSGFCEMTQDESEVIDGGGIGSLFLSALGIAFSLAITCCNPIAGLTLFSTSISVFCNNM